MLGFGFKVQNIKKLKLLASFPARPSSPARGEEASLWETVPEERSGGWWQGARDEQKYPKRSEMVYLDEMGTKCTNLGFQMKNHN